MHYTSSNVTAVAPEKVQTLIIKNSDFDFDILHKLRHLKNLQLSEIDCVDIDLSVIETLNQLNSISIEGVTNLKTITLPSQPNSSITTFLVINSNLASLPIHINALTQVSHLSFERNNLQEFDASLQPKTLNLISNKLSNISSALFLNNELTQFNASFNHLNEFVVSSRASSLKQLLLAGNQLEVFDYELTSGTNKIESLFLSNNNLSTVPNCIQDFHSLEKLCMSGNSNIASLPDWLENLAFLRTLSLNGLPALAINDYAGVLSKIAILDLSDCELETFPIALTELVNLKSLKLNFNAIKNVPDSIKNLTQLEYLELKGNELRSLPKSIYQLPKLREINIMYNDFSPKTTAALKQQFAESQIQCVI